MREYEKALKVKRHPREISYENFVERVGDFGLKRRLYDFQVRGLLYLYHAKRCILADATGLGKTVQIVSLFQFLQHKGEHHKWLLIVPPTTIFQWLTEFKDFTQLPLPVLGIGSRRERISHYMTPEWWQFYITSYQMLWKDWELIADLGIRHFVFDDAHFFRHHDTKTARIVKRLTRDAERIILATATPKQKSLLDVHSLLEALNLTHIFGSEVGFENHYCIVRKTQTTLRDGRQFWKREEVGLRNVDEFRQRLEPFVLKRNFQDVGKQLPGIIVKPVWLKMHRRQQVIHEQLRQRIIRAWDSGHVREIPNKGFHSLMQICSGTRTFGLEEDISCKLDAIEQFIDDKLGLDDKVVIYTFYKETVRVIVNRLRRMGRDDFVTITGDDSKRRKEEVRQQFRYDNHTRILIGTGAIEVGLNLQSARYLLMVNLILNAQRTIQLVGRIRRLGSAHKTVVVFPLLCKGTLEERFWYRLKYESALADAVFQEQSDVFPPLSSVELMSMIRECGVS